MFLRSKLIIQSRPGRLRRRIPEPFHLFDRLMRSADAGKQSARSDDSARSDSGEAPPAAESAPGRWSCDSVGKPGFQFRGIL